MQDAFQKFKTGKSQIENGHQAQTNILTRINDAGQVGGRMAHADNVNAGQTSLPTCTAIGNMNFQQELFPKYIHSNLPYIFVSKTNANLSDISSQISPFGCPTKGRKCFLSYGILMDAVAKS